MSVYIDTFFRALVFPIKTDNGKTTKKETTSVSCKEKGGGIGA